MAPLSEYGTHRPRFLATAFTLLLLCAGALLLRVYNLGDLPSGFFCDEAALGYNAWSILHFGVDENGSSWPLFVWSFGGYKNPVFIYSSMLPIGIFGLSEFSTRLTSALFGTATVFTIFLALKRITGKPGALCGAGLLAILPWHLHFSRIAYELISFPFFFTLAVWLLLRALDEKKPLWPAAFCLGICLYCYAIAKVFVPLILLGAAGLFWRELWARRKDLWPAGLTFIATVLPVFYFDFAHRERSLLYAANTSAFKDLHQLGEMLQIFCRNYLEFLHPRFLFEAGDPIVRHAMPGHGELLLIFAPLLIIGLLRTLLLRRPRELFFLWCLVCFPIGPSLMNEIPTASRGIIGVVGITAIAALGISSLHEMLRRAARSIAVARVLWSLLYFCISAEALLEFSAYWNDYTLKYPLLSARSIYGFQYGYRDLVQRMEQHRAEKLPMLQTATDVNQPYIFSLFYLRRSPFEFQKSGDPGYLIISPEEQGRYNSAGTNIFALRPSELSLFEHVEELDRIIAPDGATEFVVTRATSLKRYLTSWYALGTFDNHDNRGLLLDPPDLPTIERRAYDTPGGRRFWEEYDSQFLSLDLNSYYGLRDLALNGNPEYVCAYLFTILNAAHAGDVALELSSVTDPVEIWINGKSLPAGTISPAPGTRLFPAALESGENVLLLKSCESIGDWKLRVRVVNPDGSSAAWVRDVRKWPSTPHVETPPQPSLKTETAFIGEGFESIETFSHEQSDYQSYRGSEQSWWAYAQDPKPSVGWTSAPRETGRNTALAFTASMGEEPGRAELWINGKFALDFDLGDSFDFRQWHGTETRLLFMKKQQVAGSSGIFLLWIPAEFAADESRLHFEVRIQRSSRNAWFMIKDRKDTLAFERLDAAIIRSAFLKASESPSAE